MGFYSKAMQRNSTVDYTLEHHNGYTACKDRLIYWTTLMNIYHELFPNHNPKHELFPNLKPANSTLTPSLIMRPNAPRRNLNDVPIQILKIHTPPAPFPAHRTENLHSLTP
jgi:hypothetical protein